MQSCQSAPVSTVEPQHFREATVAPSWTVGRPRVAEVVDKPDGILGNYEGKIETQVSSRKSLDQEHSPTP